MTDMITISEQYGVQHWPAPGWARGFADWCVRWEHAKTLGPTLIIPLQIVDVGAGAGAFVIVCKDLWPDARVDCLEPSPDLLPYLYFNTKNLGDVHILPLAASSSEQELMLSKWPDIKTAQTLDGDNEDGTLVQCRRLDDLFDEPVQVLKIDTEGHEIECLKGAQRILTEDHPDIVIEVKKVNLNTELDPRPILEQLGYSFGMKISQDYWYTWRGGS